MTVLSRINVIIISVTTTALLYCLSSNPCVCVGICWLGRGETRSVAFKHENSSTFRYVSSESHSFPYMIIWITFLDCNFRWVRVVILFIPVSLLAIPFIKCIYFWNIRHSNSIIHFQLDTIRISVETSCNGLSIRIISAAFSPLAWYITLQTSKFAV